MQNPEVGKTQFSTLFGVFFLMMMAVFAAEVTVMELYADHFARISVIQRAFLDTSTLVLIIALPLWFFVFNPAFREKIKDDGGYMTVAFSLYVKVLAGLYLIQLLIMLVLPELMQYLPAPFESLIDGALTAAISAPLFWRLLYRLELHYRLEPLAGFLNAPNTLYVLLLFMTFLADMLQEIFFHQLNLDLSAIHVQLLDALVSVILIAPLLLILVVRPLCRLAQSEKARTNAIYDQATEAIVKIDFQGTILSFNLAAQTIFGFRSEEILGKSASLLLDHRQIDFTAVMQQLIDDVETRPLRFCALTASRHDGAVLTLDVSISKVDLEGPDEFLLLLSDISKGKATEDALLATDAIFREIFNQTEDAILFFEPGSGKILDVNSTTESLYGFSKRELQDQGIKAFCADDDRNRFSALLSGIDASCSSKVDQLVNHRRDGQQIVVSIHGKMITLQGEPVIYCTIRDISERVRLENEARKIQSKLIHANKMTSLGLMVSGVTHEINNPNNYVLSNAQLLAKIWKDAQIILRQYYREHGEFVLGGMPFSELENHTPDLFQGITDGSRRINAIVNDLKRFVRQDSPQTLTAVDINEVASSAVSILRQELARHTDNFYIDLADNLPPINGSSQQLGQVIINLLMNASQSLPDKNCAIWLETGYDPQYRLVKISVRDQGRGMPEELKDKVLEPFFSTRLDSGGTGLGLSISQTIVKSHGGQIVFFSQLNKGTTFTVTLPVTTP